MFKFIQKSRVGGLVFGASVVLMATSAMADIVHLDDVIVDGSLCAGLDCVNGENFGLDTLRVKENNIRVHFDDTSGAGGFPLNDWRIVINDAANGGANYFAVQDSTAGVVPFKIEAGARANALYVDSNGNLGLGTANPAVNMHAVLGNTPTLRLEQDGSAGFALQTWDIAGNESGFFVRDTTNGSTLPFRILPGAPTASLVITGSSNVGVGTGTPSVPLHVRRLDGTAQVLVEEKSGVRSGRQMVRLVNNGNPQIALVNTFNNQEWEIGAGLNLVIKNLTAGTTPFKVSPAGNLTLTGTLTTTGSCSIGCDRVFDADYALPSIEDHAAEMFAKSYLPNVGPTAENGQYELTSKVLGMLNELEQAHIFISQLNDKISALEAKIAKAE